MRFINIDSDGGCIILGPLAVSWGNADPEFEANGFCSFSYGQYALEFGDLDQGTLGIYLTHYSDGDVEYSKPLVQFR